MIILEYCKLSFVESLKKMQPIDVTTYDHSSIQEFVHSLIHSLIHPSIYSKSLNSKSY